MNPRPAAQRKPRGGAGTALTAFVFALAFGALWAALDGRGGPGIFAASVALAFGLLLGSERTPGTAARAALAAGGTLLATGYGEWLQTALRIGALVNVSLPEVIRMSGPRPLAALTWRLLPTGRVCGFALAALAAAALVLAVAAWRRHHLSRRGSSAR